MKSHALTCIRLFDTRLLGAVAAGAFMLAPVYAHAQSAPMLTKALPSDGYYANVYPPGAPFRSWLDMVQATQAAQPNWMTPLVTVTPRLEQEFRYDQYDQKKGPVAKETASVLSTTADRVAHESSSSRPMTGK
jgi:hypothetical protein